MNEPKTIRTRTNLYLWMLTGRSTGFHNAPLNTGIDYVVRSTPKEVTHMRTLLKLDDTTTDFFVLGALAAARMSTALLRGMVQENDAVFPRGMLSLPPVSSSLTMLAPSGLSWPSLDGGVAGKTGFSQVTFVDLGGGQASILTNTGIEDTTSYQVVDGGGGSWLHFDKAEDYGVRADFAYSAGWGTLVVRMSPTRFPYEDFAKVILQDTTAVALMNSEGTLQAFTETSSAAKKVGLAGLSVIRRMLDEAVGDQSGYEVTAGYNTGGAEPLRRIYDVVQTTLPGLSDDPCDPDNPVGFDA